MPLPAALRALLWPLRGLPGCYVVSGRAPDRPLGKTSAERLWVELMIVSGLVRPLTDGERERCRYRDSDIRAHWTPLITPHALRHNYVTMCWERGFDVYVTMKLVGHASIKTTMDIYTHLSDAQMSRAAAQVEDMFAPPRATFVQRDIAAHDRQYPPKAR